MAKNTTIRKQRDTQRGVSEMVTLYTIDCGNCKRLEEKLNEAGITYLTIKDKKIMAKLGMSHMPMLEVDDKLLTFKEAVKWINDRMCD